ncbi:MAG: helix-turn-helix transcriptional regulator [Bacilli bacterium]
MKEAELLERYVPLVKFIASVIGDTGEVVLHDLSQPESSVIAIENGHMSGRKVGDSTTNLVLQILQDKSLHTQDYIGSYKAYGKDGRVFRSSSLFIKDEQKQLVGMLCVNVCVESHIQVKAWLDKFLSFQEPAQSNAKQEAVVQEYLHASPEDVLTSTIEQALSSYNVSPERMSPCEKQDIIRTLHDQGVFLLKGGVSAVAKRLKMSEPTVYRYLQKVKEESKS